MADEPIQSDRAARLAAARDRGSIAVSIAPVHAVTYWYGLSEAILAVQQDRELPESVRPSTLRGAGRRLEAEFLKLNEAFSPSQFAGTRDKLAEIREAVHKAWIERWN